MALRQLLEQRLQRGCVGLGWITPTALDERARETVAHQIRAAQRRARQGHVHAQTAQRAEQLRGTTVGEEAVFHLREGDARVLRHDREATNQAQRSTICGGLPVDDGNDRNLGGRTVQRLRR